MSDRLMKSRHTLLMLLAAGTAGGALAQSPIYRCPDNEYTDKITEAQARARGCKPFDGGNFTVIHGTRPARQTPTAAPGAEPRPAVAASAPASGSSGPNKVDAADQRARDADARAILDSELKKAEARLETLRKEYNNGEPEKLGPEHRNNQKYLDRVAELKAGIARAESDIAGIKRELARLPAANGAK